MKRCPTCGETFADSMKFCQTDGTPLVTASETEAGGNLPESRYSVDSAKTQIISVDEWRKESGAMNSESGKDASPPSPFGSSPLSSPESPNKISDDLSPTLFPGENLSQSPFDNQVNSPLPSPFDQSKGAEYRPPAPPFKEPEPMFGKSRDSFEQSPFGVQTDSDNLSVQPTEWMPPPAPVSDWQNRSIGQDTPFQAPMAGGQNQTLAIVSLVLGIISIPFCQFIAPVAVVTGFMARKKAEENPNEYGGSELALAGIITGAIGTLLLVLVVIYIFVIFAALFGGGL